MNKCIVCGEVSIWSQSLTACISKEIHLCPIHFQTLMATQGFVHGGLSNDAAATAGHELEHVVQLQQYGLWDEKLSAQMDLAATLESIKGAQTPKDITGGK